MSPPCVFSMWLSSNVSVVSRGLWLVEGGWRRETSKIWSFYYCRVALHHFTGSTQLSESIPGDNQQTFAAEKCKYFLEFHCLNGKKTRALVGLSLNLSFLLAGRLIVSETICLVLFYVPWKRFFSLPHYTFFQAFLDHSKKRGERRKGRLHNVHT
jgi:hypothetical protein